MMLSWLPLYNACVAVIGIVGIFLWSLVGVLIFLVLWVFSMACLAREVLFASLTRYAAAFWLFIITEAAVFGSLFATILWADEGGEGAISDSLELPFLGCFLLLTSSLTATYYHHSFGLPGSSIYLAISAFLGFCFICLQFSEFFDAECDVLYCTYLGAAFCTVGLHFTHVLIGVLAMVFLLVWGAEKSHFYASVVVWYWHFVDYVWLWVYLIVYYA